MLDLLAPRHVVDPELVPSLFGDEDEDDWVEDDLDEDEDWDDEDEEDWDDEDEDWEEEWEEEFDDDDEDIGRGSKDWEE